MLVSAINAFQKAAKGNHAKGRQAQQRKLTSDPAVAGERRSSTINMNIKNFIFLKRAQKLPFPGEVIQLMYIAGI